MTEYQHYLPRRVVLGLSAGEDTWQSVEAATTLAMTLKVELQCVFVEQEDLFNVARFPFARAIGPGGLVSKLSVHSIETHFNRLFKQAEQALDETCGRLNLSWHMRRPHGELLREIRAFVEKDDAVVLSRSQLREAGFMTLDLMRDLLATAGAVIIPSSRQRPSGPIISIGKSSAIAFAEDIGRTTGIRVEQLTPEQFGRLRKPAAAVVASIVDAERIGGDGLFRKLASIGAMAVLLSNRLAESEQLRP